MSLSLHNLFQLWVSVNFLINGIYKHLCVLFSHQNVARFSHHTYLALWDRTFHVVQLVSYSSPFCKGCVLKDTILPHTATIILGASPQSARLARPVRNRTPFRTNQPVLCTIARTVFVRFLCSLRSILQYKI